MQNYYTNVFAPLLELGCTAHPSAVGAGSALGGPCLGHSMAQRYGQCRCLPRGLSQGEVPKAGQSLRGESSSLVGGFGQGTHRLQLPPFPEMLLQLGACSQHQRTGAQR